MKKSLAILAASSALLAPAAAMAQDTDGQTRVRNDNEIVVNASRRAERLVNVASSITAFSGEELNDRVAADLNDFIRAVPGVVFEYRGPGQNTITIRGINSNPGATSIIPKGVIGYYVNDLPLSDDPNAAQDVALFDLQRVEVLRGPQGTLFGEGAIGGLVRFITNEPDLERFGGHASFHASHFRDGNWGYNSNAAINVPLVPGKVAARFVVGFRNDARYIDSIYPAPINRIDRDANRAETLNLRALLKWQASDVIDVNLTYIRSDQDLVNSGTGNTSPSYTQTRLIEAFGLNRYDVANGTVNWDVGPFTVTSSTNYAETTNGGLTPTGGTATAAATQQLRRNQSIFAQELRLVSNGPGPLRYVFGGFLKDQDVVTTNFGATTNVGTGVVTPTFSQRIVKRFNQKAVFGELEYDIVPLITVLVGGRYTTERSSTELNQAGTQIPGTGQRFYDTSYSIFTPKASIRLNITPDHHVYFTAARGFRGPGTQSTFSNTTPANGGVFGAERLWTYEIGAKGLFFDRRLYVALAAYYNDWSDLQISENPTASFFDQRVINAGKVVTKGFDAEVRFQIIDNLRIGGTIGVIDTEIKAFTPAFGAAVIGRELTFTPDLTASAYIDGSIPLTDTLALRGRVDYSHTGRRFADATNTRVLPAYDLVNARLSLESDNWSVFAFARNLGNEFAVVTVNPAGTLNTVYPPREIGVGVNFRF